MTADADAATSVTDDPAADARKFFDVSNSTLAPPSVATAAPNLPPAAPPAPAAPFPATPSAGAQTHGALPGFDSFEPPRAERTRAGSRALRRGVSWLISVALLAGLIAAGMCFGPRLLELSQAETDTAPRVPLPYPIPIGEPPPVRSAVLVATSASDGNGTARYEANVDFESEVSQVMITADDGPTLEIQAVFNDAVIRRADEQTWYRTERGTFPFDGATADSLIPTLDALLPAPTRRRAVIVEAAEASLDDLADVAPATAGAGVQRLVIEIPQDQLAMLNEAPAEPATDATTDAQPEVTPPPLIDLPIGTPNPAELAAGEPVTIEVWVDSTGVVRHLRTDKSLGSESLTVVSTSAETWTPAFPDESMVEPMTATAVTALAR